MHFLAWPLPVSLKQAGTTPGHLDWLTERRLHLILHRTIGHYRIIGRLCGTIGRIGCWLSVRHDCHRSIHWLKVRQKQSSFNTSDYRPLSDYRTISVLKEDCFVALLVSGAIGRLSWISWIDRWQSSHTHSQQPIRSIVRHSRPIVR